MKLKCLLIPGSSIDHVIIRLITNNVIYEIQMTRRTERREREGEREREREGEGERERRGKMERKKIKFLLVNIFKNFNLE